ncbi:hypothetical protein ACFLX5_05475 [Chloroflexota bacterium]
MEKHTSNLGKLVGNLQSLEFALRAFLLNDEISSGGPFSQSADLFDVDEDDIVPLNAFTDYDNLRGLIMRYNRHHKILSAHLEIDETLAGIRDAIAHGRVSGSSPLPPLKLLKFSKPDHNNDHVRVTFSALMTEEWFGKQIRRVHDAILRVSEANKRLQDR